MAEFREISEAEWEQMPPPKPPKPPNRWDELLGVVESGKIVVIDVADERLRGTRIGLARSASTRGFKLEFRAQGGQLAIRRSDQPVAPKEAKEPTQRKPRGHKSASAASDVSGESQE